MSKNTHFERADSSFLITNEIDILEILENEDFNDDTGKKNDDAGKCISTDEFSFHSLDNYQFLRTTESTADSRIELSKWMEETGRDPVSSKPTISSLAGYVNIAYPIARSATISKEYKEPTVFKIEDLRRQIVDVSDNLKRIVRTMAKIDLTVQQSLPFDDSTDVVKAFVDKKATQLVENCEYVNALLNIVGGTIRIADNRRDSSEPAVKTYGSSIDMS